MANKKKMVFSIIILFTFLPLSMSQLTGFDCGNRISNVTTISLVDVEECNIEPPKLNITSFHGQVLQVNHFKHTKVYQCAVKITRQVWYCTFNNHASKVKDGLITYYKEITRDECLRIHEHGLYRTGGLEIHDIPRNNTHTVPISLAGSVTEGGSCSGAAYTDHYGAYKNVVVDGFIEFRTQDYEATINLDTNKIILKTGTTCPISDGHCMDMNEGYAFYSGLPEDPCNTRKYSVIFEGPIQKTQEIENPSRIVYMLETEDITFALSKIGERPLCGYNLIRTEHPKLFIIENIGERMFEPKSESAVENMDIFAYVNSKFVYVEKHIRKQISNMYFDLLHHKCELERNVLKNTLAIAIQSPDAFAYRLMNSPGYMAVMAGEVIHLIKCTQVDVSLRPTKECYHQLPVYFGERQYFLTPRTHMLVRTGTQVECNSLLPTMYQFNNSWIELSPQVSSVTEPETLKPETKPTWRYLSAHALAMSGIYSNNDLEKMRDRIMFPVERGSVLNTVALGMAGRPVTGQGVSIQNFLDEETINNIAASTWKKLWGGLTAFGNASAGILGFFIVGRIIKLLIDTIIHGYAIYSIYGFSCALIGSVWNSVTQLLLHLGQTMKQKGEEAMREAANAGSPIDNGNQDKEDGKLPTKEHIYDEAGYQPKYLYPKLPRANSTSIPPEHHRYGNN